MENKNDIQLTREAAMLVRAHIRLVEIGGEVEALRYELEQARGDLSPETEQALDDVDAAVAVLEQQFPEMLALGLHSHTPVPLRRTPDRAAVRRNAALMTRLQTTDAGLIARWLRDYARTQQLPAYCYSAEVTQRMALDFQAGREVADWVWSALKERA